jgi:hypothetical protein
MKRGDLIRHHYADGEIGVIIEDDIGVDLLILWSDGHLEWCDAAMLEVICR